MPNKLMMPAPNEKQRMALLERHRYVGYGGARGGGKSWFVRWKAVLLCLQYPGIKVLITRRTYRELYNNHIAPLLLMLGGTATYLKSDKIFFFPTAAPSALATATATRIWGNTRVPNTTSGLPTKPGSSRKAGWCRLMPASGEPTIFPSAPITP